MKFLFVILSLLVSSNMQSQQFDIDQTLRLKNQYGDSILNHIKELSDSLYQILEIPYSDNYLKFSDFSNRAREIGEIQFMTLTDKLYLPFSIHIMEAYRKRINGKWEIIKNPPSEKVALSEAP